MKQISIDNKDEREISWFELIYSLGQHKKWIVGISFLLMLIATVIVFSPLNGYTAELKIKTENGSAMMSLGNNFPIFVDPLQQRLHLMSYYKETTKEDFARKLSSVIKVRENNKEGLIIISAKDKNAVMAANIANVYGQELIRMGNTAAWSTKGKLLERLEKRLSDLRLLIVKHNNKMEQRHALQIIDKSYIDSGAKTVIDGIGGFQAEAADVSDVDILTQNEELRLANLYVSMRQLLAGYGELMKRDYDPMLYDALMLEQKRVFLLSLEQKLIRKIQDTQTFILQDNQIIIEAQPPRNRNLSWQIVPMIGVVGFLGTSLCLLLLVGLTKVWREYKEYKIRLLEK